MERISRDIQLKLNNGLKFHCDDTQTIRLVEDNSRLRTKLRHDDIQNMSIKQEYKKARIQISYLPTAEVPADGFTGALPRQKFNSFVQHLGLVEVKDLLEYEDCDGESGSDFDSHYETDSADRQ
jgi:hypothetical protein